MTLTADVPTERLRIEGSVGDVTVRAKADATAVHAEITKITRAVSQARADEALDEIRVSLEMEGEGRTLVLGKADHPGDVGDASYAVRWEVTAPPHLAVAVETPVGDVRVEGFTGEVRVAGGVGNVVVRGDKDSADPTGPVTITTEVGNIHVNHVGRQVSASGGVGEIRASASGRVELTTSVGDVRLQLLEGSGEGVQLRASVGNVIVAIPPSWKGRIMADVEIGSTAIRLGSVTMRNVRHRRHHFSADIGGASEPVLDVTTEVGDVHVQTYTP